MAEKKDIVVRAVRRDGRGKNDSRRARRNGQVPVTMYGGEGEAVSALAQLRDLAAILRSDTGRNTIFTLEVEGEVPTEPEVIGKGKKEDEGEGSSEEAKEKK